MKAGEVEKYISIRYKCRICGFEREHPSEVIEHIKNDHKNKLIDNQKENIRCGLDSRP